jgi:uncharacterized protein
MSSIPTTWDPVASPSDCDVPDSIQQIGDAIAEALEVVAPVWPLNDYVAVNPYAGISHRSFLDARAFLKVFSDCETLMPLEHYAMEFARGHFTFSDIEGAITELASIGISPSITAPEIVEYLLAHRSADTLVRPVVAAPHRVRPVETMAEVATRLSGVNWTEAIVDEISKHCSAHYDVGQATWTSPYKNLPLYQAWRTVAEHDRNIEILGLKGFRKFVTHLPFTPEAAIVQSLRELGVPGPLWSTFLLCQAFSIPGWSAWTKYQSSWTNASDAGCNDLTGLLAIRLAYDVALANANSLSIDWDSMLKSESASFTSPSTTLHGDTILRYTLLRATEIGYRNELLQSLSTVATAPPKSDSDRKLAQFVFCIDVRSERIRRQLETQSCDIETFGFAGFFGMAFDFVKLGQTCGDSHLPVLLKPQFKLYEGLRDGESLLETFAISDRQQTRTWRKLWKAFQSSAIGCFSCVETTGLLYGFKLLGRTLGYELPSGDPQFDGLTKQDCDRLGPTLRGLNQQGITTTRQVDLAEGMLRNLGLTQDFAHLVVFCGHACQTENNPLAAGLDCGACGGHSGEPNARFAALLLNQPYIRQALAERGIKIPADTHFLGGRHNTTTDSIELCDIADVPVGLQAELQELRKSCAAATQQTQTERLPSLASNSMRDLLKRSRDWSEVRPEWGLAGNAAFIVAPRSFTKNANLDARAFLHSYDFTQDSDGSVLETIMTAPMVVANWINMQYYASTVDQRYFGSGNKTVHNVVGHFGILSGNGGDLMTGLPWQSLHTGEHYQHLPMRLQVVIAAPREMIERVIAKHELVANLLNNAWLALVAIEDGRMVRYCENGNWEQVNISETCAI